ncbi:MAG: glycosyltransferase family 4 protein [Phycisphaerae bacterium]
MKIALVCEQFDPQRSSAGRMAVWLAQQWFARGHEVHVVCHRARPRGRTAATAGASYDEQTSRSSPGAEFALPAGITLHRVPALRLSTGVGYQQFARGVARVLKTLNADVVHSFSAACAGDVYHPQAGVYQGGYSGAVAPRERSGGATLKRLIFTLSGNRRVLLRREAGICGPLSRGGARRVLSLSPLVTQQLNHYYRPPADRIVELPNPVLPAPAAPAQQALWRAQYRGLYGLPATARVGIFVGHDFARKGLRWAIEAVARAGDDYWLLVVGLGRARRYLDLARQLGLQQRVLFVGPTQDVRPLFAAADALLFPTYYEAFGGVILEALAAGLPVLTTRLAGAWPRVTEYHAGAVVEAPHDTGALAMALRALPTDPAVRAVLAQRCRQAGLIATPEQYLHQLEQIYADVIQ